MTFFSDSRAFPVAAIPCCAGSRHQKLSHHGQDQNAHSDYPVQAILSFSQFLPSKQRAFLRFSSLT